MSRTVAHLYVHVPFCVAKCPYCAFYSQPGSARQMAAYVAAVLCELESAVTTLAKRGYRLVPATIFFGGGTPSLLPVRLMDRLLCAIAKLPLPGRPCEWTIECNPATISAAKAALYRERGVNRISLGVQSFDDRLLKTLGRIHTARQAIATYGLLRRAGFSNINLDLIFGIPGQSVAEWREELHQAIALQPEHISTYNLTREAGTAFAALPANDELDRDLFELTIATLTEAGYRHYEISNFARPGHECQHNLAYWRGADYLGLGPSAVSTVGSRRWQNIADTARYVNALRSQRSPISFRERVTPQLRRAERVAFGLRLTEGVPARWVRGRWDQETTRLLRDGLVQWHGDRLQLSPRGLLFADEVAAAFV